MEKTAVIINAGLGNLALGLNMGGFKIASAYESDKKACEIHKSNIDAPVFCQSISDIDINGIPEVDLLSAHLFIPKFTTTKFVENSWEKEINSIREILLRHRPRAFIFILNNASAMRECLSCLQKIVAERYSFLGQMLDVARMTGMPVRERLYCVVGFWGEKAQFAFPDSFFIPEFPLEKYLQIREEINPWYYRVNWNILPNNNCGPGMYCWGGYAYERSEVARWNYMRVPLVLSDGELRKITHREIANLKGFPASYNFPDNRYRQWLYMKLMYAENINAIKMLADSIMQALEPNPWRSQRYMRGKLFEDLFYDYLLKIRETASSKIQIERESPVNDYLADFVVLNNDNRFIFELKYYKEKLISNAVVRTFCAKLGCYSEYGRPVLVLSSVVLTELKEECFDKYGVVIWDISNLLWLFDAFPEAKNELVATLEYSIDDVNPEQPAQILFSKTEEKKTEKRDTWETKLKSIVPGRGSFSEYENVCVDILKYVLGDYLTLWEKQRVSNDGLYRFDLCCKVKSGVDQDFFETVKNYFNTKYIVFEFKNYSDKITQKEIYTTEKYLYEKALRKVAVIISRYGADDNAMKAVRGCLRETGKLIICLSDDSLLDMVRIKAQGEREPTEFLDTVLDDMLVNLEK